MVFVKSCVFHLDTDRNLRPGTLFVEPDVSNLQWNPHKTTRQLQDAEWNGSHGSFGPRNIAWTFWTLNKILTRLIKKVRANVHVVVVGLFYALLLCMDLVTGTFLEKKKGGNTDISTTNAIPLHTIIILLEGVAWIPWHTKVTFRIKKVCTCK